MLTSKQRNQWRALVKDLHLEPFLWGCITAASIALAYEVLL